MNQHKQWKQNAISGSSFSLDTMFIISVNQITEDISKAIVSGMNKASQANTDDEVR